MKLNRKAMALMACTFACSAVFVGCGKDNGDGDGDGDGSGGASTAGDGDGDGDASGGTNTTGDGDGDNGPVGLQCEEPGGSQCTGTASGIVCPEDSTDGVPFTCAVGDVCKEGSCVGQCEAGATECVGGSVLRVCAANGREWVNIPCQVGQVCEDGACGDEGGGLLCIPGEKSCDGNTARTCRSDGSGWEETACPGTSTCDDGACEGSVCTVGATKCDESAQLSAALFEGYIEPNLTVIQRCVDGESWVVEPCPSDEDTLSYCTYDGFSRSEAARYRQEVNAWFFASFYQGSPDPSTFPTGPAIPAGMNASCREVPNDDVCNEVFDVFFETPAMTRECVDLDDPEGSDVWTGYTECQGFPPYAPLQLVDNRCDGLAVCSTEEPEQGCSPSDCVPGETICGDDGEPSTSYGICFYEGYSAYFSYGPSCPDTDGEGGAGPGTCTDAGVAPDRHASCNGVEVDGNPPPP